MALRCEASFLVLELKRQVHTQPANPIHIDDVHHEAV